MKELIKLSKWERKELKEREVEKRILDEAHWFLDHKSSLRDVAKNFCVSKSTVHKDFTDRLKHIDSNVYNEVLHLLYYNKLHAVDKMNETNLRNRWSQNRRK